MTDTPPHDSAAEQATLGAMLWSTTVIDEVATILTADDFYEPRHALIYTAILNLHDHGKPADAITVRAHLEGRGDLQRAGGAAYLAETFGSPPNVASAAHYARIVAAHALRRRLVETLTRARHNALTAEDPTTALATAQDQLAQVHTRAGRDDGTSRWADLAAEVMREAEDIQMGRKPRGLATGLHDLDHLLGGLLPGQLIVFAGRPGMGKSVGLSTIIWQVAVSSGMPALLFSLEMSRLEVATRFTSAATGVALQRLKVGGLDDEDWARMGKMLGETEEAPLYVNDLAGATMNDIRVIARDRARRTGPLGMIGVDYLQLVNHPGAESRQVAVSEMSRGLKLLAKEMGCPVVVAAQLNRGPESRSDKRPQLSDLRESGAVEQDSDIVVFIHRDDYYEKECSRAGEADFIVAKNRNGPTDTVTVAAQLHLSRFVSMAVT